MTFFSKSLLLALTLVLSGCLLDDLFRKEGSVKVSVTDAPADDLLQVRLTIDRLDLKPKSKSVERFEFSPPVVINNLLDLSGGSLQTLLLNSDVPAGEYEWMRLYVASGGGDSFVTDVDGNDFDLYLPGSAPGVTPTTDFLQLSVPYEVPKDELLWLIVDIDLRRALDRPALQDYFILRPAFRVIDQGSSGEISGSVPLALLEAATCTNDLDADQGNAVYFFAGTSSLTGDVYLDDSGLSVDATSPYTVVPVVKKSGVYGYTAAALPAGSYTVALTCQALEDVPSTDEDIAFISTITTTIEKSESKQVDF